MSTFLLIDDEESVRYSFRYVFEGEGIEVLTAGTAAEGLEIVETHNPDVVVLDLQLPDRSGLEVFREIHALDPKRPVVFVTAHGTTETAIETMKHGAFDYLTKPVDLDRLSRILARAADAARLMRVPAELPAEQAADRIVGRSPVMQEMCKAIGRIAPQDVNVLILGESGTGKELVARALYQHSRRAEQPFLAINCAAIQETLLESELFGHEQGAFTGATRRHIGKFEQCDGGTIFLDEIGDMAPALQSKMLRVLQEQRFERVGGHETLQTRVRVLAATNHDLGRLVEQGRFRKDLYYRLHAITIQVPPLRERLGDVPELAHYFLYRFNHALGLDFRTIAPETLELLQQYAWPGNVRELQSVIQQAMLHGSGSVLLAELLGPELHRGTALAEPPPEDNGLGSLIERLLRADQPRLYEQLIAILDREVVQRVLWRTEGNLTQASEILGLSRGTLRQKMRALNLGIEKAVIDDRTPEDDAG